MMLELWTLADFISSARQIEQSLELIGAATCYYNQHIPTPMATILYDFPWWSGMCTDPIQELVKQLNCLL